MGFARKGVQSGCTAGPAGVKLYIQSGRVLQIAVGIEEETGRAYKAAGRVQPGLSRKLGIGEDIVFDR